MYVIYSIRLCILYYRYIIHHRSNSRKLLSEFYTTWKLRDYARQGCANEKWSLCFKIEGPVGHIFHERILSLGWSGSYISSNTKYQLLRQWLTQIYRKTNSNYINFISLSLWLGNVLALGLYFGHFTRYIKWQLNNLVFVTYLFSVVLRRFGDI